MWRPLFTGDDRARVIRVVRELVAVVDTIAPRDANDHADRAILRAVLAGDESVPDPDDASGTALSEAVSGLTRPQPMLGLFGGTAGIGWAVTKLADGEVAELVCARVDALLERAVDNDAWPYDLIAGITGFGVYALARGDAGRSLASRVVRALARRARPRPVGVAWHTAPETLPAAQREDAPHGYWNLGVAHGTPGVVAFLARCITAGVERELATSLTGGAVAYLRALGGDGGDTNGRESGRARYGAWIAGAADGTEIGRAYHAAANDSSETAATPSPALAWCYHDLGVALALHAAATATGNTGWREDALVLARDCADRRGSDARIGGASLCHGAAGAGHMFLRLHHATGEASFADAARHWFERALTMDLPLAEAATAEEAAQKRLDPSLLSGAAGVALALHGAISDVEPAWDGPLLVDLPCA